MILSQGCKRKIEKFSKNFQLTANGDVQAVCGFSVFVHVGLKVSEN